MPCTAPIITMLEPFRCLFTAPTWNKMLILLRGTLLARGRRTVTTALWSTGQAQDPQFSTLHQVREPRALVAAAGEPALAQAHHRDLYPSGWLPGSRDRRNIGTPLGDQDPQTGPLSR